MARAKTQEKAKKATVRAARGEAVKASREMLRMWNEYDADNVGLSEVREAASALAEALNVLDDRLVAAAAIRESEREMQEA